MVKSRIRKFRKSRKYKKSRKYRGGDDLTDDDKKMINTRFPGPPSPVPTYVDVANFINRNGINVMSKASEIKQYILNRYGVGELSFPVAPLTTPLPHVVPTTSAPLRGPDPVSHPVELGNFYQDMQGRRR
jgi:hypothetical protein